MFKKFGNSREIFVNQDEGMFIALPITLDEQILTLETEVRQGRKYVKAGSVVKEGSVVRGILAEEYEITYGPAMARIVLEGYALGSRLTDKAIVEAQKLPKIVILPYKAVFVTLKEVEEGVIKLHAEGARWNKEVKASHLTFVESDLVVNQIYIDDEGDAVIHFAGTGAGKVSAIAGEAFIGATGSALKGLPIAIVIDGNIVVVNVGSYNSTTSTWTNGGTTYVLNKEGNDFIVAGTVPYEDADATLSLDAGNRIALMFSNSQITSKAVLPAGDIVKCINKDVMTTFTRADFEDDGTFINVSNVHKDTKLIIKIKWTAEEEVTYSFDASDATFAVEA